jgi:3-hydroxyacyl-[acyl-carrier-protein] dehydratase
LDLLNNFYEVLQTTVSDKGFTTTIQLNAGHIIFLGHFPGHPVTPGVIQMQIVHELLENHFCRKLKLITMPECKFLKILNPEENPHIIILIECNWINEILDVKARGVKSTNIFFKLKSFYRFL